eukprot:4988502-Lingulodinium_polyedra.AAC.1
MMSIAEGLLRSPIVKTALQECRKLADKTVLGIDAQYSTLMNVLYQVPHGQTKEGDARAGVETETRCIHTVRGRDT